MLIKAFFSGLILLFLVALMISGTLELSADAMIFPWIVGGAGSILAFLEIVRELQERRRTPVKTDGKAIALELKAYLPGVAWILAILPMIYLLGLGLTIPVYLLLCLKLHGEKWPLCVILTSITGGLFYVVFVVFLKVPFNEGLLFSFL